MAATLVFVAGGASVLAFQPEPKKDTVDLTSTVVEPQNAPKEVLAENSPAPVEQTPTPQPAPQTPEPEPEVENPYAENSTERYAFKRRAEMNRTLPNGLGSAWTWDDRALALGMTVDHTPEVGAVAVLGTAHRSGSVAIVETVNADGTVLVTQLPGKEKTLTAEQATSIYYIH